MSAPLCRCTSNIVVRAPQNLHYDRTDLVIDEEDSQFGIIRGVMFMLEGRRSYASTTVSVTAVYRAMPGFGRELPAMRHRDMSYPERATKGLSRSPSTLTDCAQCYGCVAVEPGMITIRRKFSREP
jgi:hypothetical protein